MKRVLPMLALFAIAVAAPACGAKQYNDGKKGKTVTTVQPTPNPKSTGRVVAAYGPFHAGGQRGEAMVTAACGSLTGRPCVRARATVGMPYQYDVNSNSVVGIVAATGFPAPGAAYVTQAGAGKTTVAAGPRVPQAPRMENRDLHIMKRQAAPGEHRF